MLNYAAVIISKTQLLNAGKGNFSLMSSEPVSFFSFFLFFF